MKTTIKTLLILICLAPTFMYGQTYISKMQYDLTRSGEEKFSKEIATLTFLKNNEEITIKFNALKISTTYQIALPEKEDKGNLIRTFYAIVDDPNYSIIRVSEYKQTMTKNHYSFNFTILLGKTIDGKVAYYTTFYGTK